MSQPCFCCGVRTDVGCRHKAAIAQPPFEYPETVPIYANHAFWGHAVHRGMTPVQIFKRLAATLK